MSVQSGNPLNNSNAIQGELDQLTEEINAVAGGVLGDANFISRLDANDPAATQESLEVALTRVNQSAGALGAEYVSLAGQISTYETARINSKESRSRIEDTDYGAGTSEKERLNVLLQAAVISKKDEESRKGILINQRV